MKSPLISKINTLPAVFVLLFLFLYDSVRAQLLEWPYIDPIKIVETSGTRKVNYQVMLNVNTQSLISAGKMNSNGDDIRFAGDCLGVNRYPYYIESGINTGNTIIWVKIDTLPAYDSIIVNMFYGNPAAPAASDLAAAFPRNKIISAAEATADSVWNYDWVQIDSGAVLTITPGNHADGIYGKLTINAQRIKIRGTLEGSGLGYTGGVATNGNGPGYGAKPIAIGGSGGGGAGHGGRGGTGGCGGGGIGGSTYDLSNSMTIFAGSGGGPAAWIGTGTPGGNGGAAFALNAAHIDVQGSINVNGLLGGSNTYSGGGGAGGGILIKGYQVNLTGTLSANGGNAGVATHCSGGGGGGGRIKIFYDGALNNTSIINLNGGTVSFSASGAAIAGLPGELYTGTYNAMLPVVTYLPAVKLSASANPSCEGSTVTFTANPPDFSTYLFFQNSKLVQDSPSRTYSTDSLADGDTLFVAALYGNDCIELSDTIVVARMPFPEIKISPAEASICQDSAILLSASGAISYTWSPPAGLSAVSGPAVTANPPATTTYTVTGLNDLGCPGTATVTITTHTLPPLPVLGSNSGLCEGSTLLLTADAIPGVEYNWSGPDGFSSKDQNPTITNCSLAAAGTYVCSAVNGGCEGPSSSIAVNIIPAILPEIVINITAGTNPSCIGDSITFTAIIQNGGTAPQLQWAINGVDIGISTSSITTDALVNGDVVTCSLLSDEMCATPPLVTSNAIVMQIDNFMAPGVAISLSNGSNPSCAGAEVTFAAMTMNTGLTNYQWKVNGIPAGSDNPLFTSSSLSDGDIISCTITTSNACISSAQAISNNIVMSVQAMLPASVSISALSTSVCEGDTALFTAIPVNGGSTPVYLWYVNGVSTGVNAETYASGSLKDKDTVSCTMTSSEFCAAPATVSSGIIQLQVNDLPPVPVITQNGNVLYSSAATGNQWQLNNMDIPGATGNSYLVKQTGDYTVYVKGQNNCRSEPSEKISVSSVGIGEISAADVGIFPNPVKAAFMISFPGTFTYIITDVAGKQLLTGWAIKTAGVDARQLEAGSYFVIITGENVRVTRQFVKL